MSNENEKNVLHVNFSLRDGHGLHTFHLKATPGLGVDHLSKSCASLITRLLDPNKWVAHVLQEPMPVIDKICALRKAALIDPPPSWPFKEYKDKNVLVVDFLLRDANGEESTCCLKSKSELGVEWLSKQCRDQISRMLEPEKWPCEMCGTPMAAPVSEATEPAKAVPEPEPNQAKQYDWLPQRCKLSDWLPPQEAKQHLSKRELRDHEINDANRQLKVIAYAPREGRGEVASAMYDVLHAESALELGCLHFQSGPIKEAGVNGVTNEVLIAIVTDRLRSFQASKYACRENALALTKLEEALHWLHTRTREREARGVEGTHEK